MEAADIHHLELVLLYLMGLVAVLAALAAAISLPEQIKDGTSLSTARHPDLSNVLRDHGYARPSGAKSSLSHPKTAFGLAVGREYQRNTGSPTHAVCCH